MYRSQGMFSSPLDPKSNFRKQQTNPHSKTEALKQLHIIERTPSPSPSLSASPPPSHYRSNNLSAEQRARMDALYTALQAESQDDFKGLSKTDSKPDVKVKRERSSSFNNQVKRAKTLSMVGSQRVIVISDSEDEEDEWDERFDGARPPRPYPTIRNPFMWESGETQASVRI